MIEIFPARKNSLITESSTIFQDSTESSSHSFRDSSHFSLKHLFISFLKELTVKEQFVHACGNGDYHTVNRILEENPKFNIDVTDQLGRTAMRLAIENEHLEVKEKNQQDR